MASTATSSARFCPICAAPHDLEARRCPSCGATLPFRRPPDTDRRDPIGSGFSWLFGLSGHERLRNRPWLTRSLMIVPLVAMLVGGGLLGSWYYGERQRVADVYEAAVQAEAEGRFADAILLYRDASGYRDADERRAAILTPYSDAIVLAELAIAGGRPQEAIAILEPVLAELPNDREATLLMEQARLAYEDQIERQIAAGEDEGDWLAVEAGLVSLLELHPDDVSLAQRLAQVRRENVPLLYTREGVLYLAPPNQRDAEPIFDDLPVSWPAWSPDRSRIIFTSSPDVTGRGGGDLYVMNADGTGARRLTGGVLRSRPPVWSPDGTRIAYTSLAGYDIESGEGEFSVRVYDLRTGQETDVTGGFAVFADSPTWSPTGDRLAVVTANMERSATRSVRLSDSEVVVVRLDDGRYTNVTDGALPNARQVAWSPSSEHLLVQSIEFGQTFGWEHAMIHLIDVGTKAVTPIDETSGDVTMPVWSPDGSRYAFVEGSRLLRIGGGPGEIWVYLPSSVSRYITWSPDGSAIVAVANEVFQPSYLVPLDDLRGLTRLSVAYETGGVVGGPPQWAGGAVTVGQFPAPGDELNHPWLPGRNGPGAAAPAPPDPIPPRF